MDGMSCDLCDKVLLADEDTRYIVGIQVYAAYDTMELTADDLREDLSAEMARLLRRVADMDASELEDQVYKSFRFDLCPACQKVYLADPLGGRRLSGEGLNESPGC